MIEPLSEKDFEEAITDPYMRGLLVLTVGMVAAPLIYIVIGLLVARNAPVPVTPPAPVFLAFLACIGILQVAGAAWFADRSILGRDLAAVLAQGLPQKQGGRITDRAQIVGTLLRGHCLLRMALTESIAIYGLLVSFLAGGLLVTQPLWNLAFLPCGLASAILLLTYPSKEQLHAVFVRTLQSRP